MPQLRRVRRSVIAFAPRPGTTRWIQEELDGEPYKIVVVPSIAALVTRLAERADQIAIVDFEAITEQDIEALAAIRDASWTGELVALGRIDIEVRMMLRVREMIVRPLGSERLRRTVSMIGIEPPLALTGTEPTAEVSPFR